MHSWMPSYCTTAATCDRQHDMLVSASHSPGGESLHLGMTSATGIPPCSSDASCKLPVAEARIGRDLSNTQKVYALALHTAVNACVLDESLLAGTESTHLV